MILALGRFSEDQPWSLAQIYEDSQSDQATAYVQAVAANGYPPLVALATITGEVTLRLSATPPDPGPQTPPT